MKKETLLYYVIHDPNKRGGEFEFCSSTQEHFVGTLREAEQEVLDKDPDFEDEEGNPGWEDSEFVIYEMTLKEVKRIKLTSPSEED